MGGDPRGPLRRAEDPRPMSREELPAGSGGQASASPGGDRWAGEEPPAAERAAPQRASSLKGPAGSGLKPRPQGARGTLGDGRQGGRRGQAGGRTRRGSTAPCLSWEPVTGILEVLTDTSTSIEVCMPYNLRHRKAV